MPFRRVTRAGEPGPSLDGGWTRSAGSAQPALQRRDPLSLRHDLSPQLLNHLSVRGHPREQVRARHLPAARTRDDMVNPRRSPRWDRHADDQETRNLNGYSL